MNEKNDNQKKVKRMPWKRVLWFVLFLLFLAATVGWFWLAKVWLQSTPGG